MRAGGREAPMRAARHGFNGVRVVRLLRRATVRLGRRRAARLLDRLPRSVAQVVRLEDGGGFDALEPPLGGGVAFRIRNPVPRAAAVGEIADLGDRRLGASAFEELPRTVEP